MDINNKIMQRHENNHVKEKTPSIAFPTSTKWHLKPGADLAPKPGRTESNTSSPVARKGTEHLPWKVCSQFLLWQLYKAFQNQKDFSQMWILWEENELQVSPCLL